MHSAPITLRRARQLLRTTANPADAVFLQRFFKTGPGDYGEGDVFLGVRVPATRKVVKQCDGLNLADTRTLLYSPYHEERLLALLILVRRFERGDAAMQKRIFDLYLAETRHINNWDLVDLSAPNIVGKWLLERPRGLLARMVRSQQLWDRRIAVLATFAFIRRGQFQNSLDLCQTLLQDPHDLMHKACGWMLREIGKRDQAALEGFLEKTAPQMPRTMLRYAIERLPEARRRIWMAMGRHKARISSATRPPLGAETTRLE